ncbi:MAG: Mur ligase family protein [Candidatus Dependentiae bacterium]|nr:Mur ligase family protein [Candidatus Dependentiae bacterium]
MARTNISGEERVGVWGLGVSGSSIIRYLVSRGQGVVALEKNSVPNRPFFDQHAIRIFRDPEEREDFFATCDRIVPSPGIDLRPYPDVRHKIVAEIDLFQNAWRRPIIGITGTLGKTSITHLLSNLLTIGGKRVATGGNIGIGMLDLVASQEGHDLAVLELSSFQLVDGILRTQQPAEGLALLPLALAPHLRTDGHCAGRRLAWFSMTRPGKTELKNIECAKDTIYLATAAGFVRIGPEGERLFFTCESIPTISFTQNWLILAAACDLLGYDAEKLITDASPVLALPHNRLEFVANIDGVDYLNDSKSTIMPATIAAVRSRSAQPTVLLLGGLSKGVDRLPYMSELSAITHAVCFGGEAEALGAACLQAQIPATCCADLEGALEAARRIATPGSCILLSPGGASFDLFRNYEERGAHFVRLVRRCEITQRSYGREPGPG